MENTCVDGHPYVSYPIGGRPSAPDNVRESFHALRVRKQVPGAIKWDNAVRQTKQHSQVKYRVLRENFYDSITECEGVLELLIGQVLMAVCYICREWCVSYDSYLIFNLPISFKFLFLKSS
jgi:hypothetical protein